MRVGNGNKRSKAESAGNRITLRWVGFANPKVEAGRLPGVTPLERNKQPEKNEIGLLSNEGGDREVGKSQKKKG